MCPLPEVCKLPIVNITSLSLFSLSDALPFFPVFLKDCAAMRLFKKKPSRGCWLKYQVNLDGKGEETQTMVKHHTVDHADLMKKLSFQYKKLEQTCAIWRVPCWWACICALHFRGSRREMPRWAIWGAAGSPAAPSLWMQGSLWKLMQEHLENRF